MNLAKRKEMNNAPTARFSGLRYRSAQNDMRISTFLPSGIPRREHRRHRWAMFAPLNDVGKRRVRVKI